ncbi:hypothetical protein [Niallia sp. Krafla_26]|uniref:hypothetical protein n=1 Tax=Niallia sp. Krafla_26 TaxID=3064703 RepID=UPI003D17D66B
MRGLTSIFIILLLLSGCSSNPSLELIDATVEISNRSTGISVSTGDKQGEIIQPISLSYHFVLKNTGKKTLGGMENINNDTFEVDDGINVYIEPNQLLKSVSEEIIGFNIYDEAELKKANLSVGKTSIPVIEPNQEGEYTFDLDLGAVEENSEIRVAPSSQQLDRLKKNAIDAALIVTIEDEEVARFDLSNLN